MSRPQIVANFRNQDNMQRFRRNLEIRESLDTTRLYGDLNLLRRPLRSQIYRTDSSLKRRIARTQLDRHQFPMPNIALSFDPARRRIDYDKIEAVLQFMCVHGIDPYLPETWPNVEKAPASNTAYSYRSLERSKPKPLRRFMSEWNVLQDLQADNSLENLKFNRCASVDELSAREKKKKRRISFPVKMFSEDLEYGPGIVEKLKAKFHRLSGLVSRDAKVSPHATGKRCPSVDDILSTTEEEPCQNPDMLTAHSSAPLTTLTRMQSRSTGDIDAEDERRSFTVHRALKIPEHDCSNTSSISDLRRKFEINVQRKPSENLRHAKVRNEELRVRPTSIDFPSYSKRAANRDFTSLNEPRLIRAPPPRPFAEPADQIGHVVSSLIPFHRSEAKYDDTDSEMSKRFELKRGAAETSHSKPFRVLEVLNRAGATKIVDNNNDDVPEFIKIGRRLRRSCAHLGELEYQHEHEPPQVHETTADKSSDAHIREIHKVAFPLSLAEIPTLSSSARVVNDDFYEDPAPESRLVDTTSPPDPDSARQRSSQASKPESTVFIRTDDLPSITDTSPPPEEPKPPLDSGFKEGNDYVPRAYAPEMRLSSSLPQLTSPQIIPHNNDDSGVVEMQRLLDKFERSRSERQLVAKSSMDAPPELPSNLPSLSQPRTFFHAVVGVRHSNSSSDPGVRYPHSSTSMNKQNIVNISVRSDAPSLTKPQHDSDSVAPLSSHPPSFTSRTTPPSSHWSSPPQAETSRKSLSAKYIEEKTKVMSPSAQEKSSEDEMTELRPTEIVRSEQLPCDTVSTLSPNTSELDGDESLRNLFLKSSEASSYESDSDEPERTERPDPVDIDNIILAGDGNPIRHTLLSLVLEEDIPALMEAMNETFTCEFEDLDNQSPSTSSILHPPEARKERRKARQVSSIRFEEASPKVYTYLDEVSAIVKKEWVEGVHVDYETYQKIIAAEVEEYKSMMAGLQQWKEKMAVQSSENNVPVEDNSLKADVSQSFPFHSTPAENSTMCA